MDTKDWSSKDSKYLLKLSQKLGEVAISARAFRNDAEVAADMKDHVDCLCVIMNSLKEKKKTGLTIRSPRKGEDSNRYLKTMNIVLHLLRRKRPHFC